MNQLYFGGKVINLYSEDYQYLQDSVSESLNQVVRYLITNKTNSSIIQGFSLTRSQSDTTCFNITHDTDNGKGALATGEQEIFETSTGFLNIALKSYTAGITIGVYALVDYAYASYDRKNEQIVYEPKVVDLYNNTLVYNRKELSCSLEQYTPAEYAELSAVTKNRLVLLGSFTANGLGNPISEVDLSNVNYLVLNIQHHSISVDSLQPSFKLPQAMVQPTSTGDVDDYYYATSTGYVPNITGDLNHIRTMIRDMKGSVRWDDAMLGLHASIPQMNALSKAGAFIDTSTGVAGFNIILSETSPDFTITTGCALIGDDIKLLNVDSHLTFPTVSGTFVGDWDTRTGGEIFNLPDIDADYQFTVSVCITGLVGVDPNTFHIVRNSNRDFEYVQAPQGVAPDPELYDYTVDPVTGIVTVLYGGHSYMQDIMVFYQYGNNRMDLIALEPTGVTLTIGTPGLNPNPPKLLTSHCPLYYVNRISFKTIPTYDEIIDLRWTKEPIREVTVINCEDLVAYTDDVFYNNHTWGVNKLTVVNNSTGFATPKGTGWDIVDDWFLDATDEYENRKVLTIEEDYCCQAIVHFQTDDEIWIQSNYAGTSLYLYVESIFNSNVYDQVYKVASKEVVDHIGGLTLLAHKGFEEGYKRIKISSAPVVSGIVTITQAMGRAVYTREFPYVLSSSNIPDVSCIVKFNASHTPIATISISASDMVLVNDTTIWAFIPHNGDGTSYEDSLLVNIDTTTDTTIATVSVSMGYFNPVSPLFTNNTYIWITSMVVNEESLPDIQLIKVDALTGTTISTITLNFTSPPPPVPYFPSEYAYDGEYLWVLCLYNGMILKINIETDTIVASIYIYPIPEGVEELEPYMRVTMQMIFDGTHIWVSCLTNSVLHKIDITTNTVISTITIDTDPGLNCIFIHDNCMWASNYVKNRLYRLNGQSDRIVDIFSLSQGGLAYSNNYYTVGNELVLVGPQAFYSIKKVGVFTLKNIIVGKLDLYHFRAGIFADTVSSNYFVSSSTVTPPMFVSSQQKVNNFNADLIDNYHISSDLTDGSFLTYNSDSHTIGSQQIDNPFYAPSVALGDTCIFPLPGQPGVTGITQDTYNYAVSYVVDYCESDHKDAAITSIYYKAIDFCFDGTYIWALANSRYLAKIDIASNTFITHITFVSTANAICFDGTYLWVVNNSRYVTVVSPTSNQFINTVTISTSSAGSNSICFDGTYIWVSNTDNVTKIQRSTYNIVATISRPNPSGTGKIFFDGTYVWISCQHLIKIDISTNAILSTIKITGGINSMCTDGTYLWVGGMQATYSESGTEYIRTLYKINTTTNIILSSFTIEESGFERRISGYHHCSFDGTYIWVTNVEGHYIAKISPLLNKVVALIPVPYIETTHACYSNGTYLWVGIYNDHTSSYSIVKKISAYYCNKTVPETLLSPVSSIIVNSFKFVNITFDIRYLDIIKGIKIYRCNSQSGWVCIDYIDCINDIEYIPDGPIISYTYTDTLRDRSMFLDKSSPYYNKAMLPYSSNTTGGAIKSKEGRVLELTFDGKRYC